MLPTFIKLENTFEAAMSVNESPQVVFYDYSGVFLVSDNPYPYEQRTYASDGIEIEDFVIEFFDMCGNELEADTYNDTFKILRNFQDPLTGLPQVEWQLNTANLDFGDQLIYFRLTVGLNTYVYSSPFTIASEGSKYTSQWWYRQQSGDNMLSIGLNMYFRNRKSEHDVSNYTSLSTGYTTTGTSRLTPFERWVTRVINNDIFEEFKKIFLLKEVYSHPYNFSGLPLRTRVFNALESKDPTADENFNDFEFELSRNPNFTYDPLAGIPVPVPPPPLVPTITLTSVVRVNENVVRYYFSYANFETTYLTYQWSLDGITWNSSTNGSVSPREITILFNMTSAIFYRITHPLAVSNIVEIVPPLISLGTPIKYNPLIGSAFRLPYNVENYTPKSQLIFEQSADGVNFRPAFYADGNQNPKDVEVAIGIIEPYFRITDELEGIRSNITQYTE